MNDNNQNEDARLNRIKNVIETQGTILDFPKKGIVFRDIFSIFANPDAVNDLIDLMCDKLSPVVTSDTVIIGLEARGFVLAPLIARQLHLPFVPFRKKGKLPGKIRSVTYSLEYGQDVLEMQEQSLKPGTRCILIDDIIATGGTLEASIKLVQASECQVTQILAVAELVQLQGKCKLKGVPVDTLFQF